VQTGTARACRRTRLFRDGLVNITTLRGWRAPAAAPELRAQVAVFVAAGLVFCDVQAPAESGTEHGTDAWRWPVYPSGPVRDGAP